jgi:hypothetical protein
MPTLASLLVRTWQTIKSTTAECWPTSTCAVVGCSPTGQVLANPVPAVRELQHDGRLARIPHTTLSSDEVMAHQARLTGEGLAPVDESGTCCFAKQDKVWVDGPDGAWEIYTVLEDSDAFGQPVLWRTHGNYSLKGFDEALEIREVGLQGVASFEAPTARIRGSLAGLVNDPVLKT